MVLQWSHTIIAPRILWSTPPVRISGDWWETLNGSNFGTKPPIPALIAPGSGLVVPRAKKASLLGARLDSKQSREQFAPHLPCFPQSKCNSLAYRTLLPMALVS